MISNKDPNEIKKMLKELTLSTNRVLLRHIDLTDTEDIYEYASDNEVTKYLTFDSHTTISSTYDFISNYMSKDEKIFGIVYENKVIGSFDLRLVPEHEKASFGYALNRKYWGKGIMTEVLKCVMHYCFDVLIINRMESTHYKGNIASRRVMQKCGFVEEGFFKQELLIKKQFIDVHHLGITREEYLKTIQS